MDQEWNGELGERLGRLLETSVEVERAFLLTGGTSKEVWSVDVETPEGDGLGLVVRRATEGAIYSGTLSLEQEFRVMRAARGRGARLPKPYGYLEDLAGREDLVMERLDGESTGYKVVREPELAAAREALPRQMAEELASFHAASLEHLPSLPGAEDEPAAPRAVRDLEEELDLLDEPHPVAEFGLWWLREHPPESHGVVLNHGDFRVGNLIVDEEGLVGVIDCELAHLGDPAEDLAWPLVRAWRFGEDHLRLGGVGRPEPYLERYNALTGRGVSLDDLFYWEVLGNVRWLVGAFNQTRRHLSGQERGVELAVAGRVAARVEHETLRLIQDGAC